MRRFPLLTFGALLLSRSFAIAVSAVWITDADVPGNWSDPTRWSTNPVVPDNNGSLTYDVTIGQNFDESIVTLDSGRTIQNLTMLASGITSSSAQTLNVMGVASLQFGTIFGAVNTNFAGSLSLSGNADLSGTGTATLLSGATAQLSAGLIDSNFVNNGTVTISGSDVDGSGTFTNQGTINVNSTASSTDLYPKLINNGSVSVVAGQFSPAGGGSGTGSYNVSAGASLNFYGGYSATFDISQNTFSGTGTVSLGGSQTYTINSYHVAGTTQLSGNVIFANAAGATLGTLQMNDGALQANGPVHVTTSFVDNSGGTISGAGGLYFDSGATATNNSLITLNTTLTNNGTINWSPAGISGSGTIQNNGTFNSTGNYGINPSFVNGATGSINVTSGTLTLGSSGTFTNNHNVTVSSGATLSITAGTWSNASSGSMTTNGGAFNFAGAWTNQGVVSLSGGATLTLGGTFATADIGTVNRSGTTTVSILGAMNNAGTTLALNNTTGTYALAGGTITGGAITQAGSAILSIQSGTLSGVSYNANLALANAGNTLTVSNGTSISGSIGVTGAGATLTWNQSSTIDNQTVTITGTSSATSKILVGFGDTLTIGSNGSVGLSNGQIGGTNGTLTNQGAISTTGSQTSGIAATNFNNAGTVTASGGATLNLTQTSTGNSGTLSANGGTINLVKAANTGRIEAVNGGAVVVSNGIVQTAGVLSVNGGTISGSSGSVTISVTGGSVEGNGTIGPKLTNSALIDPGFAAGPSVGTLTLSSDLTLTSSSQLVFDIAGHTQGVSYDLLTEAGSVALNLNGTLGINVDPAFAASISPSDVFTVLSSNQTLAGAFSNVADGARLQTTNGQGSFAVHYTGQNSVSLTGFQSAPEPGSMLLLGLGVSALVACRRRCSPPTRLSPRTIAVP